MKNTYLTSHFPLISILLFSTAFSLYAERLIIYKLHDLGVYQGMTEVFSDSGIKLTLLFLLLLFFFMVFAALKLIADTMFELSLLFFSKDQEGKELTKIRSGSWLYLVGSVISLLLFQNFILMIAILALVTFGYFIFFVYKVSSSLSPIGLIGMIFFHVFFWFTFALTVSYAMIKLYNSFIASLPV
ncbi:DUF5366 family protein [Anaerobacillus isosaccharinicus]|uniref:DUF5366 family protein n=1 Tax=Anaerobacillus isosaccharinicus TaxID=1532552 RepID=A0A1S2L5A2_9BACI|nr:DUF5366 family protein [Anaerobacillus isosaccharinicus]MBA5584991.1 DUF5366 family protein [Anaerobacillus isosaccharinicus]QOY36655.1 DUF5366 family protein [Anaerobacillus isosaccharinicus]